MYETKQRHNFLQSLRHCMPSTVTHPIHYSQLFFSLRPTKSIQRVPHQPEPHSESLSKIQVLIQILCVCAHVQMHAYRNQVHLRESVPLWAWELNLSDLAAVPLSLKLSLQYTGLEGLISVLLACFFFLCVRMFCLIYLHIYLCTPYLPGTRGKKRL